MDRIQVGEHILDTGEFLMKLHAKGRLAPFNAVTKRVVYYAPCHQREQKMARPYLDLLAQVPGLTVDSVGESECCGMGGNLGFKADCYEKSLAVGQPLMAKIREKEPEAIVTDCLSCQLQFSHSLPYPVLHPMELLAAAYDGADAGTVRAAM